MQFTADLNEFNRQFANELRPTFAQAVQALQAEDGTLLFRGPIPNLADPTHIGTHVSVKLDSEVRDALAAAEPPRRAEMTNILVLALGSVVRAKYDPNAVGWKALQVSGTMKHLHG